MSNQTVPQQFPISLLVKITLLGFYLTLVLPLPWLAQINQVPIAPWAWGMGISLGFAALWGSLSEQVEVDDQGIRVTYPFWVRPWLRRGWDLTWAQVQALKPRSTGQGGLVYYLVTPQADRAYLLPMRVAGFARLVQFIEAKTGIDTRDIKPLAQPWMYLILLGLTLLLGLIDTWVIATVVAGS
jgi:hypothetical protein